MNQEYLLKKLISIPSETGNEKDVCDFVYNLLNKEGFKVKKIPVEKSRFNIVAKIGKPKVFLQAHLDTVEPFIKFSQDEKFIYGRGACDTKASAASMIIAAIELLKQGKKDFGLLFTVGEEVDFVGVTKLTKSEFPFVIVGEPTKLQIVNGQYGILVFKISVKGKAAHTSIQEKGVNAIDLLLKDIQKLNKLIINKNSTLTLAKIEGGIADNIVPASASVLYSMRVFPNDKKEYIEEIKKITSGKVEVILNIAGTSNEVPEELSFIKTCGVVKYSTELSFFNKAIVFGPGDIKFAHGLGEKVSKKELSKAVKIYKKIVENF